MKRACPITIICPPTTGTPDPDWPLTNVSAEAPDPLIFSGVVWPDFDPYSPPIVGDGMYVAFDCYGMAHSSESQFMADLLALAASYTCQRPSTGTTYSNDAQTGTATCPDGTQASFTVPAGILTQNFSDPDAAAAWVEWANAWMLAYATALAAANLMCITPDPGEPPRHFPGPSPYLADNPGWMCLGEVINETYSIHNAPAGMGFTMTAEGIPPGTEFVQQTPISGALVGEPTVPGVYIYTITATSTTLPQITLTVTDVLHVLAIVTDTPLPDAVVCAAYSEQLDSDGGTAPYTYAFSSGTVPAWLSLSESGLLTGTPQQEDSSQTSEFTIAVTDAEGRTCDKLFDLTVGPCPVITITPPALSNGVVGQAYSDVLTAAGGTGPYSFGQNSGTMPDGLALDNSGVISGNPTTPGEYTIGITVVDACGCIGTQDVDITIGSLGNAAQTSICPTNGAISVTIPQNTYVNQGVYAGYTQDELNAVASVDAVNALSAAGCATCGLTIANPVGSAQTAQTTGCLYQLKVTGFGVSGGLINVPAGAPIDLNLAIDTLTGFVATGTYYLWDAGSAAPPYLFSVVLP